MVGEKVVVSKEEKNPKRERGPMCLLWRTFQESRFVGPRSRFGFFSSLETTTGEKMVEFFFPIGKSPAEIGKSAREIRISFLDLCIFLEEICISARDLYISGRKIHISSEESSMVGRDLANADEFAASKNISLPKRNKKPASHWLAGCASKIALTLRRVRFPAGLSRAHSWVRRDCRL